MNHSAVSSSRRPSRLLPALLLLVACGSPAEPAPGPTGAQEGAVITIVDYAYEVPESVTAGSQVTVRNEDSVTHTVTADESGLFDVTVPSNGEAVLQVPVDPGSYAFHCAPHPYMTGALVVE